MPNTGKITIYEGKSKKDDKPYSALMLTVGEWSSLHFVQSKFEMDYIKKQLNAKSDDDLLDLSEDEQPKRGGLFN